MIFKAEKISDCHAEAMPLLVAHWQEIAHYKDIPLNPDIDTYLKLEEFGMTRCYVARDNDGTMLGYAIYFVKPNLHYKESLQAVQDILYVSPKHRKTGGSFIKWCDEQLRADGVQVVHQHVKVEHNFGPLLERFGYEHVEHIYSRRLDTWV
jgi:GNAT superfamily N-acetyltransferase